jgi:hypothetical protein
MVRPGQVSGKTGVFPADTPNRAAAAAKARDLFLCLTVNGWPLRLRGKGEVSIGADLFGLAADPAKFDYQSGGRDEWLAKIHGIHLSEITPAKIREWKQSFLAAVRDDPLALREARISVNTLLRLSRSLVSRKVLRQLPLRKACR